MSKRENKRTLYPLPQVINPLERVCLTMWIPNDREHISAFFGALYTLTRWYSWERDDEKRGALVAKVWDDIYTDTITRLGECEMPQMEFRQNGCSLEMRYEGTTQWTVIYQLYDECVADKVRELAQSGTLKIDRSPERWNSKYITQKEIDATIQDDLDAVWGGCLELTEYLFEVIVVMLSMLDAVGDAIEVVANMSKPDISFRTEWYADNPVGTPRQFVSQGQRKFDSGTYTQTYEKSILDPIQAMSPAKLLDYLQSMIEMGVSIIKAGLTETYQEYCAGLLFNILTCMPDGTRKTQGIVLDTDALYQWAGKLMEGNMQDKIVAIAIYGDSVIEALDFLSLLDLGEAFRQYRIGALQKSNTWIAIVDPCDNNLPPTCVNFGFNFKTSQELHPKITKLLFGMTTHNPIQTLTWTVGNDLLHNGGSSTWWAIASVVDTDNCLVTRAEIEWYKGSQNSGGTSVWGSNDGVNWTQLGSRGFAINSPINTPTLHTFNGLNVIYRYIKFQMYTFRPRIRQIRYFVD